ncbi:lysostaphin resistance A-like protein [Nonomuraea sp. NPDC050556]|uniref:lysostaphin resistance A-like protein n=1 Tax=Nonomuraea sp. NPDC050556 TaxID=3364369 RepID=UPI003796F07D
MTAAHARPEMAGLRGFFACGGLWRLLLIALAYMAIYLGAGWVSGQLGASSIKAGLLNSAGGVFFGFTLALIAGAVALIGFLRLMGWFPALFGRQPVGGSWWMWLAPLVVAVPVVLRLFGIDYARYGVSVVVLMFLSGLLIGFVEEVLTRGIAVKMLRDAGHSEWVVAVLSSLVFALLHGSNLLSGMKPMTVALTVLYTFGFGICMYLTMRASGSLWLAVVLHGLTDPTLILATGGVDEVTDGATRNALLTAAEPFNLAVIATALILLIFIRGRATGTRPSLNSAR